VLREVPEQFKEYIKLKNIQINLEILKDEEPV
jgi:hypothetical protein